MEDKTQNRDYQQKLRLLEELKKASKDLQTLPIPLYSATNVAAAKSMLELENQLASLLFSDPSFHKLSQSLSNLRKQLNSLGDSQGYGILSFVRRQIAGYEISKIATEVWAQAQNWIDQETVRNLVRVLQESSSEDEKVDALVQFENRVSSGFDKELQELILRARIFPILESIVCDSKDSKRVREQSAHAVVALVRFNRDVFVGPVLMGPMIRSLVAVASSGSIQALSSFVKLIRNPLVYEMETNSYIRKITTLLSSKDLSIQVAAMECILELTYFARREAIEAMVEEGLVKKLVELQRMGWRSDSSEVDEVEGAENRELEMENAREERKLMENCAFTSCVTRFVVQLEMGEGLELGEKRELKQEILRRAREASVSEAEATALVAEVLWGSSPLLH